MFKTLRLVAVSVVTVLGLAACSDTDSPESPSPNGEPPLHVVLSVDSDTVPEGTSKPISARVTDQTGLLRLVPISWRSSDPTVASVTGGTITGVGPGIAMVIASAGSGADTAQILVTPKELLLDVQPTAAIVALGDTIQFFATTRDKQGNVVTVDQLSWSSSDTTAARFVNGGYLVAKAEGELSVSAEAAQRRGTGSVRVFKSPVHSITISPSTANVYKGAQLRLDVTLRDQQGRLVDGDVTFGSSNYSRATVNQDGIVTGVAAGSVVITATSGNRTGSATITVLATPAASVVISIPSDTVPVGVEVQATATPLDASGQPLTGRTIAYQSQNPSVATINSTGMVKGIADGSTNISAIVDGKVASKRITVGGRRATSLSITPALPSVSVGQQSQLSAKVLDQSGTEMIGHPLIWSSSNQAVAIVSNNGLVTALNAGSASITASSAGSSASVAGSASSAVSSASLSASVVVSVVAAPVASVQVSPSTATIIIGGGPVTLTANAFDANGNLLSGRVASWSSANPTVASVNASGVVSAIGAGSTTITANIEGRTASITVTVGDAPPAPVSSVTVSLAATTLSAGQQTQAFAVVKDAQGNTLSRAVTWSSLDTSVAKVSATGLVTAYAGGTVAIVASSEGVSGAASLTVSTSAPAPVASVVISAPTTALTVAQTVQSVVTLKDAQGNILTGRTVTYSTQNSSVITVSPTGVITAVGLGATLVRAGSGGVWGEVSFTVTAPSGPTIASISVTPAAAALLVGQTTQETAVAKDAQGHEISGTSFTWTTTNPGVATVSGTGMVSAVGVGAATIRAVASGVTGSMSVSVTTPATVASVSVSLSSSSIQVGGTAQATAVAKDAQGNTITGRPTTWSGGGNLAQITSMGLVTGLLAGTVQVMATIDGVSASADLTITAAAPLPPPTASAPELPRVYLNFPYPVATRTVNVPAGANLQAALNSAQRGDELVLAAGATWTGNYQVSSCSAGWITVRAAGTVPTGRMTPSKAVGVAKIVTPDGGAALMVTASACRWRFVGFEITTSLIQNYGLVNLEGSEISLDRMLIRGQPTTQLSRCVTLNSRSTEVRDSWLAECHGKGFDSQAIGGWNGAGPFRIVNNYLEGAGENIMFGGADPSVPGLVPSDIEIRGNHVFTPQSWRGVWTKKNLGEFKNAVRVLIEGNVFDGSWVDGQTGGGVAFMGVNQGGTARWSRVTDITFQRNLVRNASGTVAVATYAEGVNQIPDTATSRVLVRENVLEHSDAPDANRWGIFATNSRNVSFVRNLLVGTLGVSLAIERNNGCTLTDNVWAGGYYGVAGSSGIADGITTLDPHCGAGKWSWSGMTVIGAPRAGYPPTTWVSSESQAPLAAQIRGLVQQATQGVILP